MPIASYKCPSRDYQFNIATMMLMLLLYDQSYSTQIFVGYLFDLDDSYRVCRIIKQVEPIMAHVMSTAKHNKLPQ